MKLAILPFALVIAAAGNGATLTFEQAVALASKQAASPQAANLDALRRAKLPNVRLEVAANTSRTLDLFSEGPLEVRYATSVVAVDYPLWDGGALAARYDAATAKLRGAAARDPLDDSRFAQLLEAFGELYLMQRQEEVLRPLFERASAVSDRSAGLLESGEISNLIATERREAALALASRLLDIEARQIDAAARLRLLTGLEESPTVVLDVGQTLLSVQSRTVTTVHDRTDKSVRPAQIRDDQVQATTIAFEESRARLREATASTGFRAMLSGFAGIGTAESLFRDVTSDGSFGVYGLRIHLSYPLLRGGVGELSIAEARADVERAERAQDAALNLAHARRSEYLRREETAGKRIELLQKNIDVSREREESLARLIEAGVRSTDDLTHAQAERSRREVELLAAQIERWKAAQLVERMSGAPDSP